MGALLFLVIADFKLVSAPDPGGMETDLQPMAAFAQILSGTVLVGLAAAAVLAGLWLWLRHRRPGPPAPRRSWILVDGSNVMHWQDNSPRLAPLLHVLDRLQTLGYAPGVVFDANAGWKLFGRYMDDNDLADLLFLPREQVLVVPKGMQADPFLLATARDHAARIVTNDRYRDWVETYPEVEEPGFLIRGRWQDETAHLDHLAPATADADEAKAPAP